MLPFLGNISSITKKRLNRCISKRLKFCKLKIIFQTGNRLKNYFRFKDRVPEILQSNFVYKFKCGKTYRHMKVRFSEHLGVSPRTGRRVKRYVIYISEGLHVDLWPCSSLGRFLYHWQRVKPLLIGNKRKPFH